MNHGCIKKFALKNTDEHREKLNSFKKENDWQGLNSYLNSQDLFPEVVAFAEKKEIKGTVAQRNQSKSLILEQLNAYIVRNILGDNGFYPLLNQQDKTVQRALETLNQTKN